MARPPKHPWKEIKADYETGRFDQAGLVIKYGVPKSSVSTKIRDEKWVVSEQANEVISTVQSINEQFVRLSDNNPLLAEKTLEQVAKFDSTLIKLVIDANTAVIKQGLATAPLVVGSDLGATAKAIQTASDSMGITQRHAPKGDTNVSVQTNTITANGDAVADAIKRKFSK